MQELIALLNQLPTEWVLCLEFLTTFTLLAFMVKHFGVLGIYTFMCITMIVANIQVLKIVDFSFYPEPIALGKMMICFSFLASDLTTECYGVRYAKLGVWLGFTTNFLFLCFMTVTLGYEPSFSNMNIINHHHEIQQIFSPLPGFFIAGIISYLISQYLDIHIYAKLKHRIKKHIWLTSFTSTSIATLLDNFTFYFLALYLFHPNPIPFNSLIYTYILGTFFFRIAIAFCSSFMIVKLKSIAHSSKLKFSMA